MSTSQNKAFRSQKARDRFLRHLLRAVELCKRDAWCADVRRLRARHMGVVS